MKFGFVGASYTAKSNAVADEEAINLFAETNETSGAQAQRSYFGTPGLSVFSALPKNPTRGGIKINGRAFEAANDTLYEILEDGTFTARLDGVLDDARSPISIAASNIELLIIAGGKAWCYELADNSYQEVTDQLAGVPLKVKYSDGYFIVMFEDSNKFQMSGILDGTTWPGIQVNAVSVFPDNIVSIEVSHRELWVMGRQHAQPYQDTGSDEIFDVIPGTLVEYGCAATFGVDLLDNTVFWISEDVRGARQAWRASGYTPQRISTHAVEVALSMYSVEQISNLVCYSYQEGGHLFWVLYIPGTDCTWVYDVAESLWHKRAEWKVSAGTYGPHRSWNHIYAFGKHLVGDWQTGTLWEMKMAYDTGGGVYAFVTDAGQPIRRLRRSPTLVNEMAWVYHSELNVDFATGIGPQPPLTDGDGNPRPPQAMLRWSDNRGSTWSNERSASLGFAGDYTTRVIWRRLGRSRYRVYELTVSDPIPVAITDAYLKAS